MQGAFGRVVPSQKPQTALKIPHTDDPTTKYMRALDNEARILALLTRKRLTCIPTYYGTRMVVSQKQTTRKFPALEMQYLPIRQMDVRSYLQRLSVPEFHDFLMRCFACLRELHRHVLHMDLHEGNVMFRRPTEEIPYPQLVFIDFGYSVTLEDVAKNYSSQQAVDLIKVYKKYERYQLYSILVGLYEDQQEVKPTGVHVQQRIPAQVRMIRQIPNVPHLLPRKEREAVQAFEDTCKVMINEGRWVSS